MVSEKAILPVIPLPEHTILFPGTTLRIPIASNGIATILARVYGQAAERGSGRREISTQVACIPLRSPLLNKHGQRLIPQGEGRKTSEPQDTDHGKVEKEDLYGYGVAARILAVDEFSGSPTFLLQGLGRIKISRWTQESPYLEAEMTYEHDLLLREHEAMAKLFARLREISQELVMILRLSTFSLSPLLGRYLGTFIAGKGAQDAGPLADFMVNMSGASVEERLQALATTDVEKRVNMAIEMLQRQVENLKKNIGITDISSTRTGIPDGNGFGDGLGIIMAQRARKPGIPPPSRMPGLGGPQEEDSDMRELRKKIEAAKLPPEAANVAERDLKRLSKMSPAQAEYQVLRNYLVVLSEVPWSISTEDKLGQDTLAKARKQLDDDHYGLDKVKKRLLEYLAVLRLKQSINDDLSSQINTAEDEKSTEHLSLLKGKRMVDKSPILLLLGPPGVGKTSLAKSVAAALGRKFHRVSLGGVRDEAEIRGHRRTYVGAMPGNLINGLKKVGVNNPVFLLDELDKVSTSSMHGDPSSAMLEVLDPEQNNSFTDHYINIPFDLSKVLFIATANTLDTIPPPLMDRLEIITLPGYTTLEKKQIALKHLVPKQIHTNGLQEGQVEFTTDVVSKLIDSYTRESGVRNLEREIGSVCRAKAVQYAEAKDSAQLENYTPQVVIRDLEDFLGVEKYEEEIAEETSHPGIVTGLVAYSSGGNGSILFIEVADFPGNGKVQLTGKLGDVLKESVGVALSWVRGHAFDIGITHDATEDIMRNRNIHVHCPAGAVPKDGPSAGMAHTIALISLFTGKAVPPTMAMTGEISLRGRVTAVGGIKEKLIGALRAGVKTVLLPTQNRKDTKDLPQEVKDGLEIIYVSHVWETMRLVWPEVDWPGDHLAGIQSQL